MSEHQSDMGPAASITEQASNWWITLDAPQATPEDHEAFREWAVRSPERIEAILEIARMNRLLKSRHARWPDTPVEELAREVREAGDIVYLESPPQGQMRVKEAPGVRHRPTLLLALAASILGLIIGGWLMVDHTQRYETGVGEQSSVVLRDGSLITLNTASRIEVKYEKSHRLIRLLSGEALFQVAKDPTRPFDVLVGDTVVRAVGTRFNVDKRAAGTTVTVVEGKVAVAEERGTSDDSLPSIHPSGEKVTYLEAGQQLIVAAVKKAAPVPQPANLAVATAWTQRRLVFDHRPIAEVAEEFNRYNALQIEIEGAALRNEEMTAVFRANDPRSFLDFVSKLPGVRVEHSDTRVRVYTAP